MSISEHCFECPHCERKFRFQCQKPEPNEEKKLALEKCIRCKDPIAVFVTIDDVRIEIPKESE